MKKENTSIRLRKIMSEKNLRQVDVLALCKPYCEEYGIKLGKNDLSQYVSGKVEPGQKKLTILGMALDVSEAWLMGYDVTMERFNPEYLEKQKENRKEYARLWNIRHYEKKLLSSFSELSDDNKKKCIAYTENLLSNQKMEEELLTAAHERTDIKITDEMRKHDDDIMDSEDF